MALDDYFSNPSQDCLARLFDAVNAIDFSGAPVLSRAEKLVMRASERKDIFAEKFLAPSVQPAPTNRSTATHKSTNSTDSYSSFEDGLLMRTKDKKREIPEAAAQTHLQPQAQSTSNSPSDSSFSLGGSAVWVGEESGLELAPSTEASSATKDSAKDSTITRKRRSTGASSSTSSHLLNQAFRPVWPRSNPIKDTHFYHTMVLYKDHNLPIKMPLATFPEEVGDVSETEYVFLPQVCNSNRLPCSIP